MYIHIHYIHMYMQGEVYTCPNEMSETVLSTATYTYDYFTYIISKNYSKAR